MFFWNDLKHLLMHSLRWGVLSHGDSEQNRRSDMQSLSFIPGRIGTDELEPKHLASIKCRDLGIDCSFEANGATEREIISLLIEHIESEHNIPVLTADALFRLKTGIKK